MRPGRVRHQRCTPTPHPSTFHAVTTSETLGWECGLGIVRAASMVWRSNRRDWPPFGGDFKLASFKLDPKISGAKRLKTRIEARRLTDQIKLHHTALPEPSGLLSLPRRSVMIGIN